MATGTVAWGWLSMPHNVDAPGHKETAAASELPVVIRSVLLAMELALASGCAFLLVLISAVIGTAVRSLLRALVAVEDEASALPVITSQTCETLMFCYGLVAFMSWFFQRPKREFVRRLTGCGWSGVKTCVVSLVLHSVAVIVLNWWQGQTEEQAVVSWENVEAAVHRPDGSFATVEIVQSLLLVPMKEELYFRGVLVLVGINRLQTAKWSAFISSVLFAATHLVNARHLGTRYSASYVGFQVLWALFVGLFLALKLAVSGSLVQCLMLHIINNIFALGVAKTIVLDITRPLTFVSVVSAFAIYGLAITRQLELLRCKADQDRKSM
ncbi:hypothetical protein P3T76_014562 [Phytophthora citrophthora]|uniref:CAAX prenyl protease 2/Lysostaphin resistance protein A-like domain-containing protein n=1 Tax=Phytophthora citrophthora TaxID=4793 RepID=A0AAD9LBU0_9STRA|nr:hypothetical protein P3T76_014562 [Phytophthora citrophthora]